MPAEILDLRSQLLDGYEPLNDVAPVFKKLPRTLVNWRRDGFPIVKIGADWYVHVPRARVWIINRTNPDPQNAA